MGDSVGGKLKARGKTVLTGEKEENRVGGSLQAELSEGQWGKEGLGRRGRAAHRPPLVRPIAGAQILEEAGGRGRSKSSQCCCSNQPRPPGT